MNFTSNRGQNPSAIACLTIENIPVISACEAMNAATAEITMSTPRITSVGVVVARPRRERVERVRPGRDALLQHVADLPGVVAAAGTGRTRPNHEYITGRRPESFGSRLCPSGTSSSPLQREVADVGVLRLAPGDRQDHDAEDHERAGPRELREELDRVQRVEREKDLGMPDDPGEPLSAIQGNQTSIMNQPNRPPTLLVPRHWTLNRTNRLTSVAIDGPVLAERLVGPEHADRRRDDPVGREQPRRRDDEVADHRDADDLAGVPLEQPPEGERPALAPVVRPHDEQVVLDGQEDQRPEDQAEPAEGLPR